MLNTVVLVGRMVRDPELRRTGNGTAVTSFTLATNRQFASQNGEKQADFIPCVVWQKGAENVAKFCSKGSLVGIEGRLQTRTYQDTEGKNRSVMEVVCDSVQFLETKKQQEPQQDKYHQTGGLTQVDDFGISFDDIEF